MPSFKGRDNSEKARQKLSQTVRTARRTSNPDPYANKGKKMRKGEYSRPVDPLFTSEWDDDIDDTDDEPEIY